MAMKIAKEGGRKPTFNEINITPLTDIFLVLLIIMMVIAPSFQSGSSVNLPSINSGLNIEEKNATVSITKEGKMFLNDQEITEEELALALEEISESLGDKQIVVKADKQTKSSEIMKVMRSAQDAGYQKLVVAGEPLSAAEQKKLEEKDK